MAREVHEFACLVAAGTAILAPATFALTFPPRVVDEINVQVPPGPRGEVGWAIAQAGRPILPYEAGAWVVTDNEVVRWPLEDQNTSGAWQLIAYNTGAFDHKLYVRFLVRLPSGAAEAAATFAPIASADLSAPPVDELPPPDELPPADELPPPTMPSADQPPPVRVTPPPPSANQSPPVATMPSARPPVNQSAPVATTPRPPA